MYVVGTRSWLKIELYMYCDICAMHASTNTRVMDAGLWVVYACGYAQVHPKGSTGPFSMGTPVDISPFVERAWTVTFVGCITKIARRIKNAIEITKS